MDNVRPKDIELITRDGVSWVRPATGGISTSERPGALQGIWWRLDAGYDYDDPLIVWNDHSWHWLWEPVREIRLDAFEALLHASHAFFVRA